MLATRGSRRSLVITSERNAKLGRFGQLHFRSYPKVESRMARSR